MRKLALLIGVDSYEDPAVTPLKFASADVLALGDALKTHCAFDGVTVLTEAPGRQPATRSRILAALNAVTGELRPDDLFLFFFSGHGIEADGNAYLLAADTWRRDLEDTSLGMAALRTRLGRLPAGQRALVLDCCRNNPDSGKGDEDNRMGDALGRDIIAVMREPGLVGLPVPTTAVLSACRQGQRAYEFEAKGHGVFTHYLLAGLEHAAWSGDRLTLRGLGEFAEREVREWSQFTPNVRPQTPWFEQVGFAEMVLGHRRPTPSGPTISIEDALRSARQRREREERQQASAQLASELADHRLDDARRTCAALLARWPDDRDALSAKAFLDEQAWQREEQARRDAQARREREGELTNSIGMKLVRIEPGRFQMGSPASEAGQGDEAQHWVTLTRPFRMQTTPVTQAQWRSIMGTTVAQQRDKADKSYPLRGEGDTFPMYYVNWEDANAFCDALSKKEGRRYRLPTEAEWEYACRAGTTGAYAGGSLDEVGWCADNSGKAKIDSANIWNNDQKNYSQRIVNNGCQAHPVGGKRPNGWGLYDMHGNVWEWCGDIYAPYSGDATDPTGPESNPSNSWRVVRGGSWYGHPRDCRAACRHGFAPRYRFDSLGFRVSLDF